MILFQRLHEESGPGGRIDHWTNWSPADTTKGTIVLGPKNYRPAAAGVLHFDNARVVAMGS
jgi:hypothetical protein